MLSQIIFATLATVAAARFSGSLAVYTLDNGNCDADYLVVEDTVLTRLGCSYSSSECQTNGPGQIASVHHRCNTGEGQMDADIFVYPHDTLKFCRKGFCSCMNVNYLGSSKLDRGRTQTKFDFNDDQAWSC